MYPDFYGFDGNPFQLTPDERFFFRSQVHERAMAYLRYGLSHAEGFVVITGQSGTGKTTLVRHLFKELEDTEITAAQLRSTPVGSEDMLRMVSASLGLAHDGMNKATLLHNLLVICRSRYAQGRRMLLIVDEAQNLPNESLEELRLLADYQIGGRALLQSFLLGQNRLRETLKDPNMVQFRQRVIASYHIEPLSREEVREYIWHRLKIVGWNDDPVFEGDVLDGIFEASGGFPRVVNLLCDRLLLYGCIEQKHRLIRDDLRVVVQDMETSLGYDLRLSSSSDEGGAEVEEPQPSPAPTIVADPSPISRTNVDARLAGLEEKVDRLERDVRRAGRLLSDALLPLLH